MKIVLVSPTPAFPTTAGNRSRIRELARAIREMGHELVFVLLPIDTTDFDNAAHVEAFGETGYIRLSNGGRIGDIAYHLRRRILRRTARFVREAGIEAGYYNRLDFAWNPVWRSQIDKIVRDADAMLAEYVFHSRALDLMPPGTIRLLDTHDAFADRHKPYREQGLTEGYWVSLKPEVENIGFRRADTILAIQSEEGERFARQLADDPADATDPAVAIVSHFVDLSAPTKDYSASARAMFLASSNPSNRRSIGVFVEKVLPRVVAEMPAFELLLVGSICKDVPDDTANVVKLGRVENLSDAFAQAPLSINPMLVGTGINIKLLDAMAAAVPTVSTQTGLRGLPESFRGGVVAVPDDDHDLFAKEIVALAGDPKRRGVLGEAAYADARRWNEEQARQLQACLTREAKA